MDMNKVFFSRTNRPELPLEMYSAGHKSIHKKFLDMNSNSTLCSESGCHDEWTAKSHDDQPHCFICFWQLKTYHIRRGMLRMPIPIGKVKNLFRFV